MNITFLDAYTANPGDLSWEDIKRHGQLSIYDRTAPDQIVNRARESDILITNKCVITQSILEQLPKLKLICVAATGYNNIDLGAAKDRGIAVANVSNYSTYSVVQHVFSMLLSKLNQVPYYADGVGKGRWQSSVDFAYTDQPIINLSSLTMGIVGYGTIGKALARTALSFGMVVLAHRRSNISPDTPGVKMVDFKTLLNSSDVVSLHASGNPDSKHMINTESLSKMKEDAILINTSRGMLIDEDALFKWLSKHPKAFALLDVLNEEPPQSAVPLLTLKNCWITPHQAWIGQGSRQRLLDGINENIRSFISGDLLSL